MLASSFTVAGLFMTNINIVTVTLSTAWCKASGQRPGLDTEGRTAAVRGHETDFYRPSVQRDLRGRSNASPRAPNLEPKLSRDGAAAARWRLSR